MNINALTTPYSNVPLGAEECNLDSLRNSGTRVDALEDHELRSFSPMNYQEGEALAKRLHAIRPAKSKQLPTLVVKAFSRPTRTG